MRGGALNTAKERRHLHYSTGGGGWWLKCGVLEGKRARGEEHASLGVDVGWMSTHGLAGKPWFPRDVSQKVRVSGPT